MLYWVQDSVRVIKINGKSVSLVYSKDAKVSKLSLVNLKNR
jgi:hypothetical protein